MREDLVLVQLRSYLTYANVMATVAVFVALGGTSYAVATGSIDGREIKNNTVRSSEILNNNVTTRDLRNNSARGADVRNDSLTGDDVVESSLGTVPSANSADTATSATTAVNASALGGLGPDAFLRSNRATILSPVSLDDPVDGALTTTPLMTAGPVTLEGDCFDSGATRAARMLISSSSPAMRYSVIAQDGTTIVGESGGGAVADGTPLEVASGSPASNMGTFSIHDPGSSTYRSGTMFVSVNSLGDCAFAITAFG